jgi:hypothetical protein
MRLISWLIPGMALSLIGLVFPYVMAAEQTSKLLPSAQLVEVEGASRTYHLIDRDGRVVTAVVPSQSIGDIQQNSPDNTVHTTLAAVDSTTNRVKVVTRAGQTLVLSVAPEALQGLQIGDPVQFVLPAPQRGNSASLSRGQ